jgi:hypothetical protein
LILAVGDLYLDGRFNEPQAPKEVKVMEARDYCSALQTEIDGWKSKVHNAIGRFDQMPSTGRGVVNPVLSELRTVIEEHTARMEALSEQCAVELGTKRSEDHQPSRLKSFWRDLGKYRRYRVHL